MELVFQPNQEYVITLKEITDLIGVRHNDAMRKVEELANEEGFGVLRKTRITPGELGGRPFDTYQFTKKQAIAVGARLNNTMLMKVINRLEELESQKPQFQIPQTLSQALLLASQQAETIEKQNQQLEYQKPFVAFAECVSTTVTDVLIRDWAKMIGIQEKLCRKWLIEKGYMYDANKTGKSAKYRVSAEGIERGYLVQREVPIVHPNPCFPNRLGITVKMTPKGQTALTDKIKKDLEDKQ